MSNLTLEQIADLCSVSRSTVSRVINDHPNVKPEVRARVQKVIEETGYHPHPAARSLASQRSGIIGLVIPRAVQFLFSDPYYPRLMHGIAQACNAHDFILSLFLFHTKDEEQKLYPKVLRNRVVDGVIISASPVDDPLIRQLIDNQVPFVMIGRPQDAPEASFIDVDNEVGSYTAVNHLIRLGYKRIATIAGPQNTTVGLDRKRGYMRALNDRGQTTENDLVIEGDFTEVGGYMAMRRLLPHRPDAVFIASDTMALGALRAIREAGLSIPVDIAIVSFDDLPSSEITDPPLTVVRQQIRRVGVRAVETLRDILDNGPDPPRRIVMPTELVIRASCGSTLGDEEF